MDFNGPWTRTQASGFVMTLKFSPDSSKRFAEIYKTFQQSWTQFWSSLGCFVAWHPNAHCFIFSVGNQEKYGGFKQAALLDIELFQTQSLRQNTGGEGMRQTHPD